MQNPPDAAQLAVDRGDDLGPWIEDRWAVTAGAALALSTMFLAMHLEVNRSAGYFFEPGRLPLLTLLWAGLAGVLLRFYLAQRSQPLLTALSCVACAMVLKILVIDLPYWKVTPNLVYHGDYSFLAATMRLFDFAIVAAFLAFAFLRLNGSATARQAPQAFGATALGLAFVWSTLELHTLLRQFMPGMESGGVSILWSLFALGLILAGIVKRVRTMRFVGLALFGIVVWKVFSRRPWRNSNSCIASWRSCCWAFWCCAARSFT